MISIVFKLIVKFIHDFLVNSNKIEIIPSKSDSKLKILSKKIYCTVLFTINHVRALYTLQVRFVTKLTAVHRYILYIGK